MHDWISFIDENAVSHEFSSAIPIGHDNAGSVEQIPLCEEKPVNSQCLT